MDSISDGVMGKSDLLKISNVDQDKQIVSIKSCSTQTIGLDAELFSPLIPSLTVHKPNREYVEHAPFLDPKCEETGKDLDAKTDNSKLRQHLRELASPYSLINVQVLHTFTKQEHLGLHPVLKHTNTLKSSHFFISGFPYAA